MCLTQGKTTVAQVQRKQTLEHYHDVELFIDMLDHFGICIGILVYNCSLTKLDFGDLHVHLGVRVLTLYKGLLYQY